MGPLAMGPVEGGPIWAWARLGFGPVGVARLRVGRFVVGLVGFGLVGGGPAGVGPGWRWVRLAVGLLRLGPGRAWLGRGAVGAEFRLGGLGEAVLGYAAQGGAQAGRVGAEEDLVELGRDRDGLFGQVAPGWGQLDA